MKDTKTYIGDSVYAELIDGRSILLTTENGLPNDPSNKIYMEPETLWTLIQSALVWQVLPDDFTKSKT